MKLTLFDLDHTLINTDSDYEWGVFTTALGWNDAADFARQNDAYYQHYKAGTLDIHDYMRFATRAIRQQGAIKSEAAHAEFMRAVVQKAIKPQALELVRQHQAAGDVVVIVTATNEFVTRPIAAAFGVSELIAVNLVRDPVSGWVAKSTARRLFVKAKSPVCRPGWPSASWTGLTSKAPFIPTPSTTCRCLSMSPTPSPPTRMIACERLHWNVAGAYLNFSTEISTQGWSTPTCPSGQQQ